MSKDLPIDQCSQCRYMLTDVYANQWFCGKVWDKRMLPTDKEIPEWCPLDDSAD